MTVLVQRSLRLHPAQEGCFACELSITKFEMRSRQGSFRQTSPREVRANLWCISTLLMRSRAAPDSSRRDTGPTPAQLLPGPAAVSFWFSCAARSAVLY